MGLWNSYPPPCFLNALGHLGRGVFVGEVDERAGAATARLGAVLKGCSPPSVIATK